ncbi:MAG TPA: mevalonate kinase [Patescibacteria group bacterium]|nr:mevalonate kinase [Patescibacteria group bacterium]
MNELTVSAPGKLMLFGEHAVVYGHPCIVTAVSERICLKVEKRQDKDLLINAEDVDVYNYKKNISQLGEGHLPKGARFVEIAVKNFYQKFSLDSGLEISVQKSFSQSLGLGSSSAVTVCVIFALSKIFNLPFSQKELFELSYKTVLDIQGKGSGFDIAAAIYGETIYFFTAGKKIEKLPIDVIPMFVAYSGVKADTVTLLGKVKELENKNPTLVKNIYCEIDKIVEDAKKSFKKKDWRQLGSLMSQNQNLLVDLGVSIPKIDSMIEASLSAGAYGAKISGAGGGDCIIGLAPYNSLDTIKKSIESVGGNMVNVEPNSEGVKIE